MNTIRSFLVFCMLAFAGCTFAASDPPAPRGRVTGSKQQPKPSQPASNSAPEQRGTASDPLFVQSIPGKESESEATHKRYEHHEKPTLDRWLTYSTIALAFFTFALFVFTALLWLATRRLVKDTNESAKQQLRAYVNVFKVFATWHSDESDKLRPIIITVETKNAGQTPARRVAGWMNSKSSKEMPLDFLRPNEDWQPQSVSVQAPGQVNHFQCTRNLVLDAESEINIWERGFESLYVWGEIEYVDAFDVRRETTFRYVMTKDGVHSEGGKFMSCPHGNEAT